MADVTITPREMYDAILSLTASVNASLQAHTETQQDVRDHEDRLRKIEASRWPITSLGVIIALLSLVVGGITFLKG